MDLALFFVGCLWIMFALTSNTKNFVSALIFKVVPFASGSFVVYYAAKVLHWL